MGRPNKLSASAATQENVSTIMERAFKKTKVFTLNQIKELVVKSYKIDKTVAVDRVVDLHTFATLALASLVATNKVTESSGTYTVVAGKRGRPKKVILAIAAV